MQHIEFIFEWAKQHCIHLSEWILLAARSWQYRTGAERRPQSDLFEMTSRVLSSAQYHRLTDITVLSKPLNSLEHCISTTTMSNRRPVRDSNPAPLSFEPQSYRISHRSLSHTEEKWDYNKEQIRVPRRIYVGVVPFNTIRKIVDPRAAHISVVTINFLLKALPVYIKEPVRLPRAFTIRSKSFWRSLSWQTLICFASNVRGVDSTTRPCYLDVGTMLSRYTVFHRLIEQSEK